MKTSLIFPNTFARNSISILLIASAILHGVTTPERWMHAGPLIGAFYILLGIFQIWLAITLRKTQVPFIWKTIWISSLFLFILFLANQYASGFIPAIIFEPFTLPVILRKVCEILSGLIAFWYWRKTV